VTLGDAGTGWTRWCGLERPQGSRLSITILAQTFRRYAHAGRRHRAKARRAAHLRHVFCLGAATSTRHLRQIQELLGHQHLDSTQRDTRVTAHELRGAVKRLHFQHDQATLRAAVGRR